MNLEEVEFPFSNLSMYFPNEDDNKLKSDEKLTLDGKINCRKFTLNEQF